MLNILNLKKIKNSFRRLKHLSPKFSLQNMDLFNSSALSNLLPNDGALFYYPQAINNIKSAEYVDSLLKHIEWKNDEVKIFGKHFITNRKVAWYSDNGISYTYSNIIKKGLVWTNELLEIKNLVEQISGESYNSCLLNLYHTGEEGMGWHSDDEKSIVKNSAIASVSFGAMRKFSLKHKTQDQKISMTLENGSLLLMKDEIQRYWLHSLPKSKKIISPRINLTFRKMVI